MKKALIEPPSRVAQVVAVGEEFPVAPPLRWVDAPDDVTERHTFKNGVFVPPPPPPAPDPRALAQAAARATLRTRLPGAPVTAQDFQALLIALGLQ